MMRRSFAVASLLLAGALAAMLAGPGAGSVRAGELGDVFREGNVLYGESRYDEAVQRFERILKHGIENPAVHFNLGNCYFKLGRLAEALVQFEKAARLDPSDGDTRDNVALVRSRLGEKPEPPSPWVLRRLSGFAHSLPLNTTLWVGIAAYVGLNLFCALIVVRGRRAGSESTLRLAVVVILGTVFVWSAASAASTAYCRELLKEAIVLKPSTEVLSAPAEGSAVLFTLPEGHKVRLRSKSEGNEDWVHVSLESGWHGWVQASALGEI